MEIPPGGEQENDGEEDILLVDDEVVVRNLEEKGDEQDEVEITGNLSFWEIDVTKPAI